MRIEICDCGHPPSATDVGAGYARDTEGKTHCYECCAENDKQWLRENDYITLYVVEREGKLQIVNWPETLRIDVQRHTKGKHSAFGNLVTRLDVWFEFEGAEWHGINRGDSQLCRCRRRKCA